MSFAAPAAPAAAGTAEGPAIGIDLGSAHSRAAVWRDGRVEVIPNDLGGRATPSCVAFAGGELLLGDAAKSQSSLDPASAVRDLLHLLGSRVEDPHLRSRLGRWPFAVAAAPGGGGWALSIGVGGGEERRELAPEELAGLLLRSIKAQAERFLRCSVARSVISIPGHFNDGQRRATRDAARLAGFDRVELIPDSVAAAISYTTDELGARTTEERNMLVLCMGAGQLDVALHTVVDGIYETKAVTGSPVGGADIDDALLNHLVAELPQRQGAPEQQLGARARQRLRTASERMKRALSTENQAEMRIEALLGGQDFHATVRREQLEELCQPLLARCQRAVQDVLTDAAVSEESVADVVLAGCGTRLPKLRQQLRDLFGGRDLLRTNCLEERVVRGAAIHAVGSDDVLLLNVLPRGISLAGVRSAGAAVACSGQPLLDLTQRNTTIPWKHRRVFSTCADNAPTVEMKLFEGGAGSDQHCRELGTWEVVALPPAPRGVPQIEVVFSVDKDGVLDVGAQVLGHFSRQVRAVRRTHCPPSAEEVAAARARVAHLTDAAAEIGARRRSRAALQCAACVLRPPAPGPVLAACEAALAWADGEGRRASAAECDARRVALEALCGEPPAAAAAAAGADAKPSLPPGALS